MGEGVLSAQGGRLDLTVHLRVLGWILPYCVEKEPGQDLVAAFGVEAAGGGIVPGL